MSPRAKTVCNEPGCPELVDTGKCATHRRQVDRARGGGTARGRGYLHQQERKRLLPLAIGTACPVCGERMTSPPEMHLDHTVPQSGPGRPGDRIICRRCNERLGGQLGASRRSH